MVLIKTWYLKKSLRKESSGNSVCTGDTVLYPLAEVSLEVDGCSIMVEAAVSDTL